MKINEKKDRLKEEKKNYIKRIRNGNNFRYIYKDGRLVNDRETIEKIKKIYIAPAYRDVKIFLNQDLLATGVDDMGRKQYVYSDSFKKKREMKKYNQLITLSSRIENLKKKIDQDISKNNYDQDKMNALVLRIMDLCNFRSGQKKMEKKYKSHGITTIHKNHVDIKNNKVEIEFTGKKGVNNHCEIQNKNIQDLIGKIYKLSTKTDPYLFSIIDPKTKQKVEVTINTLNEYLKPYEVTTKDLRTWNANIIFLKSLYTELQENKSLIHEMKNPTPNKLFKARKRIIKGAIIRTAHLLHNTPAVCKSSYIYKNIVKDFEEDSKYLEKIENINVRNFNFEKYLSELLKKIKN